MKLKKNLIQYLIHSGIILTLLLGWLLFSLYFASSFSFSVITSSYNSSNVTSFKISELHKGEKVTAQFESKENNLGIVSVRFNTYNRINDDVVKFRIREKNASKWFYENTYKVDQFQPDDYFTFGFPIISDSQNKNYYFEIESTKGQESNAVAISKINPVFATQYQYTKHKLLANKTLLLKFLFKKIYYSFSDINFVVSSLVYLLPLIFYLFWYYLYKPLIFVILRPFLKIIIKTRKPFSKYEANYILVFVYICALLVLIFFMSKTSGYIDLMLIGLWILLVRFYRFESSISFLFALFFLLLCPFLLIFNNVLVAENSARLAYFLLVVGTVKAILELRKNGKNLVSYDVFLKNVFRRKK